MSKQFIGESIKPVPGSLDTLGMAAGEPGLPRRFIWRDMEYAIAEVLEKWKETSPCRHGGAERYVRKHWFRVRTTGGDEMTLYFERQTPHGGRRKREWRLFTVSTVTPMNQARP